MKHLIITLAFTLAFSGCSSIQAKIEKTIPATPVIPEHKEVITFDYHRLGSQKVDGFKVVSPDGWEFTLEKQESEFEAAFGLGAASVKIGGE